MTVRTSGKSKPEGRRRFEERVPDEVVRVKEKMGENTYQLEPLVKGARSFLDSNVNKYAGERLVKVELPGLGIEPSNRELEYTVDGDSWTKARVIDVAIDGRVKLELEQSPGKSCWVDLSKLRYRWLS